MSVCQWSGETGQTITFLPNVTLGIVVYENLSLHIFWLPKRTLVNCSVQQSQ